MSKRKKSVPLAELTLHEQEIVRQIQESIRSSVDCNIKIAKNSFEPLNENVMLGVNYIPRAVLFGAMKYLSYMLPGITATVKNEKNGKIYPSFAKVPEEEVLDCYPEIEFDDDIFPIQLPKHEQTPKNN